MNVYRKKIDTQKVYLRPPNSSTRVAPTKYQLARKQTPTENQTKPKRPTKRKCPTRQTTCPWETTSPQVRWKNNTTQTTGSRIKPHQATNKDNSDCPVAYNRRGVGGTPTVHVGGTPTIRAYLTPDWNRSWNANTLQMYTRHRKYWRYWTRGHPLW